MIIRDNREKDNRKKDMPIVRPRQTRQKHSPRLKQQQEVKTGDVIYKYLSHHYIMQRSVIFIVDTHFSSQIYTDLAKDIVLNTFEALDTEDYFGYISLEKKSGSLIAEKKGKMQHIKKAFLNSTGLAEDFSFEREDLNSFDRALETALKWQAGI